jgi:serine/threonine protein kinase/tetratricopeptide (TPR) repeat protein
MADSAPSDSGLLSRLQRALADVYVIDHEIGGGGMSRIFVAEERALARTVVIKVLPPILAVELNIERFAREIRFAASLQQANIIPVLHASTADGLPYYTMPFVEGLSLRERLERHGTLPVGEALAILLDVAKALAYAHARGVVHRDIKPANILLSGGTAVVTDFGIAKAMLDAAGETEATLTALGTAVGTPAYMAPEQAAADPATDHRADIYSWGVLAYELLSGAHPFAGIKERHRLIAAHMVERPRPLRGTRRDEVPPFVADLVMRCLDKDPNARPQSAEAVVRDLERHRAPSVSSDFPAGPLYDSIAVLPFANGTGSPDDDYLSDGITDELIHALAKLPGLRVVARTSAFVFKGRAQNVCDIARELGVACVLAGTVRRSGTRLRITAELVGATDAYELWSERYDRELADMLDVQDDIARSIVDTLRLTLLRTPSSAASAPRADMGAYDLYLKGRFHWNLRTEAGLFRSLEFFDGATKRDPGFLLAHAGLADAFVMLAVYGAMSPHDAMPKALMATERVLAEDPYFTAALTARASVRAFYNYDWDGAERDFVLATETGRQYPTTHHWYAMHHLVPRRRFDEAQSRLDDARALDPLSQPIAASTGILKYYQRLYDEAERIHQHVLDQDPSFALSYYFLGLIRTELGRHDAAIEALRQAVLLTRGSPEVESALAVAYGRAGENVAAQDAYRRLAEKAATRYVSPVLLAQAHLGLSELEAALQQIERGYDLRATEMPLLNSRPTFDALRGHSGFEQVMRLVHGAGVSPPAAFAVLPLNSVSPIKPT